MWLSKFILHSWYDAAEFILCVCIEPWKQYVGSRSETRGCCVPSNFGRGTRTDAVWRKPSCVLLKFFIAAPSTFFPGWRACSAQAKVASRHFSPSSQKYCQPVLDRRRARERERERARETKVWDCAVYTFRSNYSPNVPALWSAAACPLDNLVR